MSGRDGAEDDQQGRVVCSLRGDAHTHSSLIQAVRAAALAQHLAGHPDVELDVCATTKQGEGVDGAFDAP